MDVNHTQNVAPISPCDNTSLESLSFYDHFPYVCRLDSCCKDGAAMVSGNLIKSNRCHINQPYEIKH
jgi:hypothetical protein